MCQVRLIIILDNLYHSLFLAFQGSKLHTGKTGEARGGGGGEGGESESSLPLLTSSLPSFFFLREFFSLALLSERLEQAISTKAYISGPSSSKDGQA